MPYLQHYMDIKGQEKLIFQKISERVKLMILK